MARSYDSKGREGLVPTKTSRRSGPCPRHGTSDFDGALCNLSAILILDFAMEKFPNFARKQGQFWVENARKNVCLSHIMGQN